MSASAFLKRYGWITGIIAVYSLITVVILLVPKGVNWDASVYVGMGKFLFSYGRIGTWEVLRPIGWPLLLGLFWKIGLNPYSAGAVFEAIAGGMLIVLVYLFGERLHKNVGIISALILLVTPIVIEYSILPTTDILSTTIAVAAVYVFVSAQKKRSFFWAGVLSALAFLFRFPQGIIVVCIGLGIIVSAFQATQGERFDVFWGRTWRVAAGFLALAIPFLIINKIAYGNAFLPIEAGNAIIAQYAHLYFKGFSFYFEQLLKDNILFIFALVPIVAVRKRKFRSNALLMAALCAVMIVGYFLYQPHKEYRYAIAYIDYLVILAGYGIAIIFEKIRVPIFTGTLVLVVGALSIGLLRISSLTHQQKHVTPFEIFFKAHPNARILSTNAYPLGTSDVLLVRSLYYDWSDAYVGYELNKKNSDYVALDECDLETSCPENAACRDKKELLLQTLDKEATLVLQTNDGSCQEWIYGLH